MIQNSSKLIVIDNSGARVVFCIKVLSGYKKRYGFVGDMVMVSIRDIRVKKTDFSKIKRGDVLYALIVRTKSSSKNYNSDSYNFLENSVVLLNKQKKCIGTRIFGIIPKFFRFSKFLKIIMISSGVLI